MLKLQFILFPMANDEARSVVGVRLFDVLLGKQHLPFVNQSRRETITHTLQKWRKRALLPTHT